MQANKNTNITIIFSQMQTIVTIFALRHLLHNYILILAFSYIPFTVAIYRETFN